MGMFANRYCPVALSTALVFIAILGSACGAVNGACQVVDTAHHACTVLHYLGPDGGVEEVNVSGEEVASFARETKARRAAGHDAGAP
jgi:hypothetical protein